MPVCIKMIAGTTSDISAVGRNRPAVKDYQHPLKASEPIALPTPVTCF
jgi:phage tail protein X